MPEFPLLRPVVFICGHLSVSSSGSKRTKHESVQTQDGCYLCQDLLQAIPHLKTGQGTKPPHILWMKLVHLCLIYASWCSPGRALFGVLWCLASSGCLVGLESFICGHFQGKHGCCYFVKCYGTSWCDSCRDFVTAASLAVLVGCSIVEVWCPLSIVTADCDWFWGA